MDKPSEIAAFRANIRRVANGCVSPSFRRRFDESDLVQESLLSALGSVSKGKQAEGSQTLAWLNAILRNRLIDLRRTHTSQKRNIHREATESEGSVHDCASSRNSLFLRAEIEEAIGQLEPRPKYVVISRVYGNMSFAEIGLSLGCSSHAARKVWERAIESMRRFLDQDGQGS